MARTNFTVSRRDLLRASALGFGAAAFLPPVFRNAALASALELPPDEGEGRVLVVVELAGGNDGLNTVVPHGHDAYYRARPKIAIDAKEVLPLNEEFGLHPRMVGLKALWDAGNAAIVHGCGYPEPNRSHFTSMEYWHTATPHAAEPLGWLGRFADARWPDAPANTLVDIAPQESMAVRSDLHAPIVFSDPSTFLRVADREVDGIYRRLSQTDVPSGNGALDYLRRMARTAERSSKEVRDACRAYETPVSYGADSAKLAKDLRTVAALLDARFPARVFHVSMGGFDTHGSQNEAQNNLLMYVGDALEGFLADLARFGRSRDVAVLIYTEFGRRFGENRSQGTDHGTATPLFVVGEGVRGGLYGTFPNLDDLDEEGDVRMTADFRRVYATMLSGWMGLADAKTVLRADFEPFDLFETAA